VKEFARIEADLKALKGEAVKPANLAKLALGKGEPDKMVGKAIGDILIGLLLPAFNRVQESQDRITQTERNLHLAFALAAYRADIGRYPAKLDDLAPKYLDKLPDDLFAAKPLVYKPEEKGYLLYSIGVDGKDDGGRTRDDDPPGDDLVVRMPLPPRKAKE
jgi:hypothetical protein